MHDITWIRAHPAQFDQQLATRGVAPQAEALVALDEERRKAITALQLLQQQRNQCAKEMGALRDKTSPEFHALRDHASLIKTQITTAEAALTGEDLLTTRLSELPNLPHPDVPVGPDESSNREIRSWGEPPVLSFTPKQHFELGEALGWMDFEQTAKTSGARFVTLTGPLARLERALAQFMLDLHTQEFGYLEVMPPALVRDNAMFAVGQLPKFAEDSFQTTNGYRLIPTSEVPLTCMVYDKILSEAELPLRFTAYSPCFRSEAGSAGRDTRGMIRQHQFSKVELVSITPPDTAIAEHERMTKAAETVLERLGLPYRVILLSTGDMGFAAQKTYDLEVWLPGQGQYREISSCSYGGNFVGRRMNARFRSTPDAPTQFVHTNNGSGLAIGRTIVAIMENYQQADGTIALPECLWHYMGGLQRIEVKPFR